MANKIEQAYENGRKIRHKGWGKNNWIIKYDNQYSIDQLGDQSLAKFWSFYIEPKNWEILHEDLPLFTQTDTIPETLIINGIKYKRDDN